MLSDIFKFILRNTTAKGRLEREVMVLRKSLQEIELIPWGSAELELLSLEQIKKTKRNWFKTVVTGVFNTIYQEPVINFVYHKIQSGGSKGLILARTYKKEYVYRLVGDATQVFINTDYIGLIDTHGRLIENRSKRVIGSLDIHSELTTQEIYVGKIKVGNLNKPEGDANMHERALQLFRKVDKVGEEIVVSLMIFELIKRNL